MKPVRTSQRIFEGDIFEGDILICKFQNTDLTPGKNRPAVVIKSLEHDMDFLVCMISSQLEQYIEEIDEIIEEHELKEAGLRLPSMVRTQRLLVLERSLFLGGIGMVTESRLESIKKKVALWTRKKEVR